MPQIQHAAGNEPPAAPLGVTWISNDLGAVRAGEDRPSSSSPNSGAATWRSRDGQAFASRTTGSIGSATRSSGTVREPRSRTRSPPATPSSWTRAAGADAAGGVQARLRPRRGEPVLVRGGRAADARDAVTVEPRITERRLAVVMHRPRGRGRDPRGAGATGRAGRGGAAAAVAHLVAGCLPEPDWSSLLLDAHAEGWAAVGGAVAPPARGGAVNGPGCVPGGPPRPGTRASGSRCCCRRSSPASSPRRNGWPAFAPEAGLPQDQADTALFDGRIVVRLPRRSGRRPT